MDMFATNCTAVDWAIVGVYLAGIVVLGLVVNRYVHSVADYMVAGRSAGTALNVATFLATGLCLVTVMYSGMEGFNKGFAYMIVGVMGMAFGLFLGSTGFVVRKLRAAKLTTLPEYFQQRYSRRVRVAAGVICALAGILNMGLFPKMGATFITYATGLGTTGEAAAVTAAEKTADTSAPKAAAPSVAPSAAAQKADEARKAAIAKRELTVNIVMTVIIAIALLYTVTGGMVAVIVTDYVQFVLLALGLGIGLYFCLTSPQLGWDKIAATWQASRGEAAFNPVYPGSYGWFWVAWQGIHFGAAALCWAPEASRTLTAKDPETARKTFLYGSPGQFIRLAIPALFGIAAFAFVAHHADMAKHFRGMVLRDEGTGADQAMPLVLGKLVPAGLLGLMMAGMVSALMSTHDSYFLCWASVITRDIIAPLRRRELTDKQQIRITRIIIVAIGAFLLVWGLWYKLPASVWNYMAVTGSVYLCGALVVLVGGMYWKRASSAGALAALIGGLASVPIVFLPKWFTDSTVLMGQCGIANYAVCVLLFIVFSWLFPDKKQPATQEARP
ncbi:MAG: sodium:solute symporter family protein [Planctomycetes bacterium]|nr:sodium:solute symporter family protein [Planctomycetota bacterium]